MEAESVRFHVASSEDGKRGPQVKECMWVLEAGKGKETNSPKEHPERKEALMGTLILAQWGPCWISDL